MPIANDRCSFEVVYKKDAEGVEAIDHVVVRTGVSDAAVTLTISQVYNLARLLNLVPAAAEQPSAAERPSGALERNARAITVSRAQVLRSE